MRNTIRLGFLVALLGLSACASGEVGEECGTLASESDCVDGAVCSERDACPADNPDCGAVGRCRLICSDDRDCPNNGSCEDVRDSAYKSCIPPR